VFESMKLKLALLMVAVLFATLVPCRATTGDGTGTPSYQEKLEKLKDQYQQKLEQKKGEAAQQTREIQLAQQKLKDLGGEFLDASIKSGLAEKTAANARTQSGEDSEPFKTAQAKVDETVAHLEEVKNLREAAKSNLEAAEGKYQEINQAYQQLLEKRSQAIRDFKEKFDPFQVEPLTNPEQQAQINRLKAARLEAAIKSLSTDQSELSATEEALQHQLIELEKQTGETFTHLEKLDTKLDELNTRLESLSPTNPRRTEIINEIKTANTQFNRVSDAFDKLSDTRLELLDELQHTRRQLNDAEINGAIAAAELKDLQATLETVPPEATSPLAKVPAEIISASVEPKTKPPLSLSAKPEQLQLTGPPELKQLTEPLSLKPFQPTNPSKPKYDPWLGRKDLWFGHQKWLEQLSPPNDPKIDLPITSTTPEKIQPPPTFSSQPSTSVAEPPPWSWMRGRVNPVTGSINPVVFDYAIDSFKSDQLFYLPTIAEANHNYGVVSSHGMPGSPALRSRSGGIIPLYDLRKAIDLLASKDAVELLSCYSACRGENGEPSLLERVAEDAALRDLHQSPNSFIGLPGRVAFNPPSPPFNPSQSHTLTLTYNSKTPGILGNDSIVRADLLNTGPEGYVVRYTPYEGDGEALMEKLSGGTISFERRQESSLESFPGSGSRSSYPPTLNSHTPSEVISEGQTTGKIGEGDVLKTDVLKSEGNGGNGGNAGKPPNPQRMAGFQDLADPPFGPGVQARGGGGRRDSLGPNQTLLPLPSNSAEVPQPFENLREPQPSLAIKPPSQGSAGKILTMGSKALKIGAGVIGSVATVLNARDGIQSLTEAETTGTPIPVAQFLARQTAVIPGIGIPEGVQALVDKLQQNYQPLIPPITPEDLLSPREKLDNAIKELERKGSRFAPPPDWGTKSSVSGSWALGKSDVQASDQRRPIASQPSPTQSPLNSFLFSPELRDLILNNVVNPPYPGQPFGNWFNSEIASKMNEQLKIPPESDLYSYPAADVFNVVLNQMNTLNGFSNIPEFLKHQSFSLLPFPYRH